MSSTYSDPLVNRIAALKVLPVLIIDEGTDAVALCQALAEGGIRAVEITLRTPAALDAIYQVKKAMPDFQVSAGTVIDTEQMQQVADAGVDFAVSPGMTERLVRSAEELSLPFLPGVSSASDVLRGRELGLNCFKLFPAVAVGGLALLKSLASPLSGTVFCPTGGLTQDNFTDFLALPNVVCVGGSWMADSGMIKDKNWSGITAIARETLMRC